jgi:hypothetical protein
MAVRSSAVILGLALVAGCGQKQPAPEAQPVAAKIAEVTLGRAVNSAHQVDHAMDTFAPTDSIFASVKTENTPAGTRISTRWVYTEGGAENIITENALTTTTAGTGYTSFHIANPGPWPAGSYEVRVGLNGEVKETKSFRVSG